MNTVPHASLTRLRRLAQASLLLLGAQWIQADLIGLPSQVEPSLVRETATADPGPTTRRPGADDDQDQLSNAEEALYGSHPDRRDSDNDGQDDWHEAHNMTNPNRAPYEAARRVDRFRFNTRESKSDEGISPLPPIPPTSQWVDSFEGQAWQFPAADSVPLVYSLTKRPLDLAHGMVRFWYIPDAPLETTDTTWRTLLQARGTRDDSSYEWRLEIQPSSRRISFKSSLASGELRENLLANLPAPTPPIEDAFEVCLSYTAGCTWISVNGTLLFSQIPVEPGRALGLGVDVAGVSRLLDCPDRRLAIGGRLTGNGAPDQPARGMLDEVEWYNAAMGQPFPMYRAATPWGATRESSDLRRYGGWANPAPNGQDIQINLRRGWEGPIPTDPNARDPYRLERREWGATGPDAWRSIREGTRAEVIVDRDVTAGKWYEYRLPLGSKNYGPPIWGHAGQKPALTSGPGFAIVVGVERTLLGWEDAGGVLHQALEAYITGLKAAYGANNVVKIESLRRMEDDPNLDGQLDPRDGPVAIFEPNTPENTAYKQDLQANKQELMAAYDRIEDSARRVKLLVLIGHATVPLAGAGAEDGHLAPNQVGPGIWQPSHAGAWACDAWYGDFDGQWTDVTNLSTGASCYVNGTARTDWQSRNLPNDGKFDQVAVPPNAAGQVALEAAVGRIDFSKMPGFRTAAEMAQGEAGYRQAELRLTAAYLNKATAYRSGRGTQPTVNVVRTLFGSPQPPSMPCLHAFISLARPAIMASTRQFNGALPDSAWEDLFDAGPISLWGLHGGYGSYNSIHGTFGAVRNSAEIARWENAAPAERGRLPERWSHALFTFVSGSFLADWNHEPEDLFYQTGTAADPIHMGAGNLQKAILSQSKAGLATFFQFSAGHAEKVIVLSRAAAGFPLGVALLDTVELSPRFPCHGLYLLGDPTLVAK